jgi:predicted Zn-dependent protease
MGYSAYFLVWFALAFALRYPWLAAFALVFFALRNVLPDPVVYLRTSGRIRMLRGQIQANPANVTARRDLAMLLLERRRPKAALVPLEEARVRDPKNAEIAYLIGLSRYRSGDARGALEPLVQAVELDPRVRFGEPYLVAALALTREGRGDEAEDALERYLAANSSSVEGWVRLAKLRLGRGDRAGARQALDEARRTWAALPGYKRRKELSWWFRSQLTAFRV